jgi:hypothetical protein
MDARRLYILFLTLSLAGYIWIGVNTWGGETGSEIPTVCLFKEVTGIPCPSCGATRSLMLLMRGDVRGAFLMNPLGFLLAAALVVVPFWILSDVVRRRESFYRTYRGMERMLSGNIRFASACAALVIVNWIWNISKGL